MDIILLYEFHIASRGQNTYTPLLKQNFKFSHRKFFMTKKSFTLGHIKVSDFCGSDVSGLECQRARKKSCVAALLRVIIEKKNKKILIFHQGNEICCHPDGDAIFKFFFNSKNQVIQHGRIVHPNIWHHWLMFILIFHFLEKIAPAALADIFPNLSFSCENSSY